MIKEKQKVENKKEKLEKLNGNQSVIDNDSNNYNDGNFSFIFTLNYSHKSHYYKGNF